MHSSALRFTCGLNHSPSHLWRKHGEPSIPDAGGHQRKDEELVEPEQAAFAQVGAKVRCCVIHLFISESKFVLSLPHRSVVHPLFDQAACGTLLRGSLALLL